MNPALVAEPVKVNPLVLPGGEEESLFQMELSEGSEGFLYMRKGRIDHLLKDRIFFLGLKKEQSMYNGLQLLEEIKNRIFKQFLV